MEERVVIEEYDLFFNQLDFIYVLNIRKGKKVKIKKSISFLYLFIKIQGKLSFIV